MDAPISEKKKLTIVSPMTGFDMTSPSISGHHKISLNDGNILFSILPAVLPLLIPKDEGAEDVVEAAIASVAIIPSLQENFAFNFQRKPVALIGATKVAAI